MTRKVHKDTGLREGRLKPCPQMPNCVCSMHEGDRKHYRPPWRYHTGRVTAKMALVQLLKANRRAEIIEDDEAYIHVVFTIPVFGFKDDVEFYFPADTQMIHFRSASRVGYWDLWANKWRMHRLYKKLSAKIELAKKDR